MKFFIRAAHDDLVKQLANQFVSFLEAFLAALRTLVFDFFTAHTAKCLIALQAILWICNEVKTDRTRQCLFEEFIRVSDRFIFVVPSPIVLIE